MFKWLKGEIKKVMDIFVALDNNIEMSVQNSYEGDPMFSNEVLRKSVDGSAEPILHGDVHIGYKVTTELWTAAIFNDCFYYKMVIQKPSYFNGYKASLDYIKFEGNKSKSVKSKSFTDSVIESVITDIRADEMLYDMELISEQEYMEATERKATI